jgi:hypothetical protein
LQKMGVTVTFKNKYRCKKCNLFDPKQGKDAKVS